MPTYDYICGGCGARLEIYQSMSDSPKRKCPKCKKSKLQRQIGTGAAILFKGSGFYQTDYRSSSYAEGAKKDSADAKPKESAPTAAEKKPVETKPKAAESTPTSASKSARKKPS
jgi:putative FmdB family regulatory protein